MSTATLPDWSIPGVNLHYTLGPLFLAHCFNWCLYGLLWLQVYSYYYMFPRDAPRFKLLVYFLLFVDTVSMVIVAYSGWLVFVANWGNKEILTHLGFSWASVPASAGFVALVVQSFYAYRIYIISKSWYMPAFIVLLSGIACGFSFGAAHQVSVLQTFTYIRHLIPSIWLSFGISADFFTCATLVYYLMSKPSPFGPTNRVIVRIVRISIETALVTIIAASFKLFLIFSRHDNMHLIFCLLLPRLYTNALMGTLNSRSPVFGGGESFQGSLGPLPSPTSPSVRLSWTRRFSYNSASEKHSLGETDTSRSGYLYSQSPLESSTGTTHYVGLNEFPPSPMTPGFSPRSASAPASPISPPPTAKTMIV